ncbi:MAG TPA: polysaccharide biosynthesis/export family protein [Cyclobacteriaceae bacterium]|nr:polysaccharide biosynthesis/export family protein [Cyclobacteriaceae bacterium]
MKAALYLSFLLAVSSCISNKRINYLQNLPDNQAIELDEFIPYAEVDYEYILQPFDIVDIDFASSNEDLLKAFEFTGTTNARVNSSMTGGDVYFHSGYSIDKNGYVRMPIIGLVKIGGLTEEQAREKIEEAVNAYFKEAVYVRLRTGGIRFTALGEFNSVGTKMILKNRATIFDALALAGESNILAKKNELFLIRQYDGGTKIHQINLNDRRLLASPFYFIQPNDILYLQPMKIRQIGTGDNLSTSLQLGIGIVTAILFVYGLTSGIF